MLKSFALLALVVTNVLATLIYPDFVPQITRRQAPGTPEYQCHADCGAVIQLSRTVNYCTSSNFTTSLNNCLERANQYNMWQYYGASVTRAAQGCGLSAVPVNGKSATNGTSTTRGVMTTLASNGTMTITTASSTGQIASRTGTATGTSASATSSNSGVKVTFNLGAVVVLFLAGDILRIY